MLSMVLKINDKFKIEGESTLSGFEKTIDVDRVDHGVRMPMVGDKSSNSRTAGKCVHGELDCTMRLNRAYPKLVEACVKGNSLGKVEAFMVKMAGAKITEVLKYTLSDVYVSAVDILPANPSAAIGDLTALPEVKACLNYQSIAITYNVFDDTGENKGSVSCEGLTGTGA